MRYLLFLFLMFLSTVSFSQVTTGSLIYELTDVGLSNSMRIQSMEMLLYFTPEEQVLIRNSSISSVRTKEYQFYDGQTLTQFLDWQNRKTRTETDMSKLEELGFEPDKMEEAYHITFDKSDTKEILGFTCYKATIDIDLKRLEAADGMPPGEGEWTIVAYITEDIELLDFNLQQFRGLRYKGTPLMWTTISRGTTYTMTANSFSEQIDFSVFEYPDDIYNTEDQIARYILGSFSF